MKIALPRRAQICSRGQHRAGFGETVEEHTSPFRRTNADALPRLRRGLFQWRDAFGRYEN